MPPQLKNSKEQMMLASNLMAAAWRRAAQSLRAPHSAAAHRRPPLPSKPLPVHEYLPRPPSSFAAFLHSLLLAPPLAFLLPLKSTRSIPRSHPCVSSPISGVTFYLSLIQGYGGVVAVTVTSLRSDPTHSRHLSRLSMRVLLSLPFVFKFSVFLLRV
eukprot:2631603-Rhodomonas_salina.1